MGLTREQHKDVGERVKRIVSEISHVYQATSGAYEVGAAGPPVAVNKLYTDAQVLRTVLKSAAAADHDVGFAEEIYGP